MWLEAGIVGLGWSDGAGLPSVGGLEVASPRQKGQRKEIALVVKERVRQVGHWDVRLREVTTL